MPYEKVEGENAIRVLSELALKYLDEETSARKHRYSKTISLGTMGILTQFTNAKEHDKCHDESLADTYSRMKENHGVSYDNGTWYIVDREKLMMTIFSR